MPVTFKRQLRKNPLKQDEAGKYYPHLLVWGAPATIETLVVRMKEYSSLTEGDIRSVLINFVKVMREELYAGRSVNIADFGVFALAATTEGSDEKEDCTAEKIKSVRITFRASSSVRPNLTATRAEDRIEFVDLESQVAKLGISGDGTTSSGGSSGSGSTEEDPFG